MEENQLRIKIDHLLDKHLEAIFDELVEDEELDSGDIPPLLFAQLIDYQNKIAEILTRWVINNK